MENNEVAQAQQAAETPRQQSRQISVTQITEDDRQIQVMLGLEKPGKADSECMCAGFQAKCTDKGVKRGPSAAL